MKHLILFLLLSASVVTSVSRAQVLPYKWEVIDALPFIPGRYNDIDFIDDRHGWVIQPFFSYLDTVRSYGMIFRTSNGGSTWQTVVDSAYVHFRSIQFKDKLNGWVGSIGPFTSNPDKNMLRDTIPLFSTNDGGETWQPITEFIGEKPKGICGLYVLDDQHIFGCGRYSGPGVFIKSTDGGATWHSRNISNHLEMAIDCYFWSPDSGIVAGGSRFSIDSTVVDHDSTYATIILTTDGGETWREIYRSESNREWCWKIAFPSRSIGYVSVEMLQGNTLHVLKTTDGGLTWERKNVYYPAINIQGIGFLNNDVGFIAGRNVGGFWTDDGGDTWYKWANNGANRFRFIGDTLGFVVGRAVSKLNVEKLLVDEETKASRTPRIVYRESSPFIEFDVDRPLSIDYTIIDVAGRELHRSQQEQVSPMGALVALPSLLPRTWVFVRVRVEGEEYLLKL